MYKLASFWAGGNFSVLEYTSAVSFLRQGHSLTIFTFGEVGNVPSGVEIQDSREIFPADKIIRYTKSKSPALHANMFRYALLAKTDFMWVDLDIIAIRPLDFNSDHVFAYVDNMTVNNAVLKLPKSSPTLNQLLHYDERTVGYPPATSKGRLLKYKIKSLGKGMPIASWPWGSIGPRGLTHFLQLSGEISHALPPESFYTIPSSQTNLFADPGALSRSDLSGGAYAIHLWGKYLRRYVSDIYGGDFPDSSFMGQEIITHAEWANKNL